MFALLTACSPPVTGAIAFTVEGDRLIAIVHICEGTAEDFQIIPEGDVRDGYLERQFWGLPAADGDEYRLDIDDAAEFASALAPDVSYSTSAESGDDSGSARGPNITAADLAALADGDVVYRSSSPTSPTWSAPSRRSALRRASDEPASGLGYSRTHGDERSGDGRTRADRRDRA